MILPCHVSSAFLICCIKSSLPSRSFSDRLRCVLTGLVIGCGRAQFKGFNMWLRWWWWWWWDIHREEALMLCIVINPLKGVTLVPSLQSRRRAGQELFSYCVLIPLSAQRCLSPELQCQAAKLSASLSIKVIWVLIERHVQPVNLINIVSPRQPFLLLPPLSLSLSVSI